MRPARAVRPPYAPARASGRRDARRAGIVVDFSRVRTLHVVERCLSSVRFSCALLNLVYYTECNNSLHQ